jgi:plastocyanin
MRLGITATLLTCVAGAGIAVGALTLEPQPAPTAAPPAAATSTPRSGQATDGYGPTSNSGGNSATGSEGGSATNAAGATLEINGFQFSAIRVGPGATVTVVNNDSAPHTATAEDGSFETDTIPAGATGSFTAPTEPGSYPFFCAIHPRMTGTLIVE